MWESNPHVNSSEVRNLIPQGLLLRWHLRYFFNTLIYTFFHDTWLCPTSSKEKASPNSIDNIITRSSNHKLLARLEEIGKSGGGGKILELPRVRDISPQEFYHQYIVPNKPVVLEGAALKWRCTREWTPEFFQEKYGKNPILVTDGKNWSLEGSPEQIYSQLKVHQYTVSDLIDEVKNGGSKYATFYPFLSYHPELYEDLDLKYLANYFHMNRRFPWQKRFYPKLFLGGAGTSTSVHCAGHINLNVQIYGEKQWDLWAPQSSPFLYPAHEISNALVMAVDFRNPDLATFPLYQYADRYRTVLKAGDIIFVPSYWWHGCYNFTPSISTSNFILRIRSSRVGKTFSWVAAMDPWTFVALILGNESAAKEWEKNLPKLVYQMRNSYWGRLAGFFHFFFSKAKEKLGLSHSPAINEATKLLD